MVKNIHIFLFLLLKNIKIMKIHIMRIFCSIFALAILLLCCWATCCRLEDLSWSCQTLLQPDITSKQLMTYSGSTSCWESRADQDRPCESSRSQKTRWSWTLNKLLLFTNVKRLEVTPPTLAQVPAAFRTDATSGQSQPLQIGHVDFDQELRPSIAQQVLAFVTTQLLSTNSVKCRVLQDSHWDTPCAPILLFSA